MPIDKFRPANAAPPLHPIAPGTTGPDKTAAQPRTNSFKPHAVLSGPAPQQTGAATAPRRRATLDSLRSAFQASGIQAETIAKEVGSRMISGDLKLQRRYTSPATMETTSTVAKKFAELRSLFQA